MRTGTPNAREACCSSAGRSSPIRGTIQPCSAPQASASSSHAAARSHRDHFAQAAKTFSRPEGSGGESFMKKTLWQEL
jgi:hypothetical protein